MSKNFLIVIDMQNDFVTGALGSGDAQAIVGNVVKTIEAFKDGDVLFTADTHIKDYEKDPESKVVPVPHCITATAGWLLVSPVAHFVSDKTKLIRKGTFGILDWERALHSCGYNRFEVQDGFAVTLCGLCTDICVVSNAVSLRTAFPDATIKVVSDACAGTSPEAHEAALKVMQSIGVKVITVEDLV